METSMLANSVRNYLHGPQPKNSISLLANSKLDVAVVVMSYAMLC